MQKSASSFICRHPPIQWSCDASPRCSLPQRNGVTVSEMKLKLTMHANSRKKKKKKKREIQKVQGLLSHVLVQCQEAHRAVTSRQAGKGCFGAGTAVTST